MTYDLCSVASPFNFAGFFSASRHIQTFEILHMTLVEEVKFGERVCLAIFPSSNVRTHARPHARTHTHIYEATTDTKYVGVFRCFRLELFLLYPRCTATTFAEKCDPSYPLCSDVHGTPAFSTGTFLAMLLLLSLRGVFRTAGPLIPLGFHLVSVYIYTA